MALAFDVETIAIDLFDLAPEIVGYLDKRDDNAREGAESQFEKMAISPFTGRVVSIACFDTVKERGAVIVTARPPALDPPLPPGYKLVVVGSEAEAIAMFWKACEIQRRWISFNGRGFDVPFLAVRSAVLGLDTCAPLVMSKRYADGPHVDLKDRVEAFGAVWGWPFNFDVLACALGVRSPKASGMNGAGVGAAWNEGRVGDVARYNCDDTVALVEVARRLDGPLHLNLWRHE